MATRKKADATASVTKKRITKTQEKIELGDRELPNFFICTKCGKKVKNLKNFPAGKTDIFKAYDYHVPICSECFEKLYLEYFDMYSKEFGEQTNKIEGITIRRLCMMFNLYYSEKILKSAIKSDSTTPLIFQYIKQINLWQYRNKSFDTTIEEERKENEKIESIKDISSKETDEETKEEIDSLKATMTFFGEGLGSKEDYKFLQEQYDEWTTCYECNVKAQKEIFKRLSLNQWETWKAKKNGEDTKELDKTFQNLLDTAKIQPKQNSSDALSETQTFGTLLDKWENTRPLPEIDEELKDVDKIAVMITVWFKGHLAKMLNMKNRFSKLYDDYKKKYTVEKPTYEEDTNSEFSMKDIFDED